MVAVNAQGERSQRVALKFWVVKRPDVPAVGGPPGTTNVELDVRDAARCRAVDTLYAMLGGLTCWSTTPRGRTDGRALAAARARARDVVDRERASRRRDRHPHRAARHILAERVLGVAHRLAIESRSSHLLLRSREPGRGRRQDRSGGARHTAIATR